MVSHPRGAGVRLETASGEVKEYDYVIMACHSDQTLRLLSSSPSEDVNTNTWCGVTDEERKILESFGWNQNEAVLHSDTKVRAS
jgi:predicted NAD/FAD-binding protein